MNSMIGCIYRDINGDLWISTFGDGLFRVTPQGEDIHYTTRNGLPSNFVHGILQDNQGFLWISTFTGLVRMDPISGALEKFRVADDWISNEFTADVFFKGQSGRLYFGNLRGFVVLWPLGMQKNPNIPPVILTGMKIFNQPETFDKPFSQLDKIQLSYRQNMFSFDFTALNYTNSHKNLYAYKLEGFHNDWIYCHNERTALFMNLDPGSYTFRVKGANNDGIWNDEGTSVRIFVTPPWWQTGWAYVLYAILMGSVVIGLWRLQVKRIHIRNELNMREFETQKLHEIDRIKSRFLANISHEFRTPLTLILGPLSKMLEQTRGKEKKEELKLMQRNALRLQRLINQLLDLSKIEAGKMKLQTRPENIVVLLNRLIQSFESQAKIKGTTFYVYLPLGKKHLRPDEILNDAPPEKIEPTLSPVEVSGEIETEAISKAPSRKTGIPLVLIVEDNRDMRNYMRDCLAGEYQIFEAGDGQEGLIRSLEKIPDLIISDVMMPKMDGFELCEKLKSDERTCHIPLILLTARAEAQSKIKGLELGADDYLIKPFERQELHLRVKNLIESHRLLRERFSRIVMLQPEDIAVTPVDLLFMQRLLKMIEEHMGDENFDVTWLAFNAGLSRMQLHRKLHALTGQTTTEFIRRIRLQNAASLLRQRSGGVAEIAYSVGFKSLSYFTSSFRKQFGMLPSEYATKFH
ncbi:response regulator [candidate division KSB1 bacterium]|nr:response regulator [candidate division KSB1 bacterium]